MTKEEKTVSTEKTTTSWSVFVDRIFWAATLAVSTYVATEFRAINRELANISRDIAVLVKTVDIHQREIELLRRRLDKGE